MFWEKREKSEGDNEEERIERKETSKQQNKQKKKKKKKPSTAPSMTCCFYSQVTKAKGGVQWVHHKLNSGGLYINMKRR